MNEDYIQHHDDSEEQNVSVLDEELLQLDLLLTEILVYSGEVDSLSSEVKVPDNLPETLNMIFAIAAEHAGRGGIEKILRAEGLWSLIEEIEAHIDVEEAVLKLELQIQEELAALEGSVLAEEQAFLQTIANFEPNIQTSEEGGQTENPLTSEHEMKRIYDGEISQSNHFQPKDPVMKRRFAKYKVYSTKPPPKPFFAAAQVVFLNHQQKAKYLRESAPPIVTVSPIRPPRPPTKADIMRASWAKPDLSMRPTGDKQQQRRRDFIDAHTRRPTGDWPDPPDPPSALTACPPPGQPLIAHQLRLRGLPMRCTEADIVALLGPDHAARVMPWNEDGFKEGIKILRARDGWPTGEAVVKFESKPAALHALPDLHGRRLGTRRVTAGYVRLPTPPNRGRILVAGIKGKTSARDLTMHFKGWDVAADEAGQPQMVTDRDGVPTGEAVVIFATEAAAVRALRLFDFDRPLDGRRLRPRPLPPLAWDEITGEWLVEEEEDDA